MTDLPSGFGEGRASADRPSITAHEAKARFTAGSVPGSRFLSHGNGRSYGDSCLRGSGFHIRTTIDAPRFEIDHASGIVSADSGVLLADLIDALDGTGWFPPVVPGTKLVTLGGALANDIHGKNHHLRGTFGCHVLGFELLRSDGSVRWCSADLNADLFAATIGGLGLTGHVTRLEMRLMPVAGQAIMARTVPFGDLAGYFDIAAGEADTHEYAVAWLDQMSASGRGLFFLGDHAEGNGSRPRNKWTPSVPFRPPVSAINRLSLRLFNTAYRLAKSRKAGPALEASDPFFFPLDAVKNWNRLYGPRGLFQHQSVLPEDTAREAIAAMLALTRRAGQASFLTVLKRFGTVRSPGLMSFPRAGHTLTLDFPNLGSKTLKLLNDLDAIVVGAGGAVNPYKDARMSAESFAAGFPVWKDLEALRDPAFCSDFWARTALTLMRTESAATGKMQPSAETGSSRRSARSSDQGQGWAA